MTLHFAWDAKKAESNWRRHGVTFEEAATVFGDPLARIHDDPGHSERELREHLVGCSKAIDFSWSFTERGGTIRLISARRATRHEREDYEESPQA